MQEYGCDKPFNNCMMKKSQYTLNCKKKFRRFCYKSLTRKDQVFILNYKQIHEIHIFNIKLYDSSEIDQKSTLMRSYINQLRSSEKLCQKNTTKKMSKLHCRFVTNNVNYFLIGPLKLEEISLEPFIVVYHNVLYDTEIEHLKSISRHTVHNYTYI